MNQGNLSAYRWRYAEQPCSADYFYV